MTYKYYFFYLEISLRDPKYKYIYAFENVSHIPTEKLIGIINIDLSKDPYLTEGYVLKKTAYRKHKEYLSNKLPSMEFGVFSYCLRLYSSNNASEVRSLYKKSLME